MAKSVVRDISPCIVEWDTDGTPVVFKPSLGGVKFSAVQETVDVKEDGQGDTPVGVVTKGKLVKIEVPMTRATQALLNRAIYGSTIATDLIVSNKVGDDLADSATVVTIKPLIDDVASVDASEWIQIFKCTPPVEKFELGFDNENQRVFMFEMYGLPDDTVSQEGWLYKIGDDAV